MTDSWFYLKDEQLCDRPGCSSSLGRPYPAYYDGLCAFCYAGSGPAEKATALFLHKLLHNDAAPPPVEFNGVRPEEVFKLTGGRAVVARLLRATGYF